MEIQIALPDELANSLSRKWGNLEQTLLEMLVIKAYQEGEISAGKVGELLGFSTRLEVDAFLKEKEIYLPYDKNDLAIDSQSHYELRQMGKLSES